MSTATKRLSGREHSISLGAIMPAERLPQPAELAEAMSLYRVDLGPLPQGYIDWQLGLARAELQRLVREHGIEVLVQQVVPDGFWPDGNKLLRACIETKGQAPRLWVLEWHDGNQAFMRRHPSGGWGLLYTSDLS